MPLLSFIIVILVVGVLVWAIDYIPWIDPTFKQIAKVVAVIATVIWILSFFLPVGNMGNIRVGH